ncbi:MAG: ABC transporter ATP-binding protein [Lachnospiraceae bacterium]|nr:ABC transporter ATP-binding protein [Lachnospiraceae bacterium]
MEPEQMLGKRFESGRDLSGGQWQRVALARAFYSDADILVLDEPTAALDSRMEKFVFDKFYELAKERTVFFITHRLATVRKADRILVLKNGRICGFDSHENLLRTNPYYSELYHMQADLYE